MLPSNREPLYIVKIRGPAFAVDHKLSLAAAGIYCCDDTLQTSGSGNVRFRSNGSPLPSGAAMLQIVAPFTRRPLIEVARESPHDSTSAFVNQTGEFVITNHVADIEPTVKRQWLIGLRQAPPSDPGRWVPDRDALVERHARAVGDDAGPGRTVV